MSPVSMRFIVKHGFVYGEKRYMPGEEWEPAGARNDAAIIRHYVRSEQVIEPLEEVKPRTTRVKKEVQNA